MVQFIFFRVEYKVTSDVSLLVQYELTALATLTLHCDLLNLASIRYNGKSKSYLIRSSLNGPSYLSQFIKASDVHHHYTRGSTANFIVPYVSGVAATTFNYCTIKDWNSLPSDVKRKCMFNGFNNATKRYFRTQLHLMETDTFTHYFIITRDVRDTRHKHTNTDR